MKLNRILPPKVFFVSILAAFLLLCASCSWWKGEEKSPGDGALGGALLKRLPPNTLFFVTTNTSLNSYKLLRQSPFFSSSMNFSRAFEDALKTGLGQEGIEDTSVDIINLLKKSGVLLSSDQAEDVFEEIVTFGVPIGDKLEIGVFASAASKKDLQNSLPLLIEAFRKLGTEAQEEFFDEIKGFKLNLQEKDNLGLFQYAYAASTKDFMVVSTNKEIAVEFLKNSKVSEPPEFKQNPIFQEAIKGVPNLNDSYAAGFLDLKRLMETLSKAPELKDTLEDLRNIPFDGAVFASTFQNHLSTDLSLLARPNVPEAEKWLNPLSMQSTHPFISRFPSSVFLYLGLNGKAFSKSLDISSESGLNTGETLSSEEKNNLKDVAIALELSRSGSPFPDIVVAAETEEPQSLLISIERTLSGLLELTGLQLGQWSTKKINDREARFINSPMGIGIFLATADKSVLLSSSETALKNALQSIDSKSGGLLKKLGSSTQTYIEKNQPCLLLHVDFRKVGELLESLEGTLAAFSGGNSQFDKKRIEDLKQTGLLSLSAVYTTPLLKIHSELLPHQKDEK
ncbi:MAG: hypothetical protein GYA55_12505 [SAR324 cluster bacterium]|uniref:DUF3352 domain-containing protein n=1 Tax=SAR324 cluster bacterium TaxID=2024889 RepID=A0A7X9FTR3_9DELT|nr:hypothetical protein [SAR324 cluster bacterium]